MILVPLILAAAMAAPTPPAPQPQHVIRRVAPRPDVRGDSTIVPLDMSATLPAFTASSGGRTLRLGFDTGAPGPAHLFDRTAKALGLVQIGQAQASDPSGRNRQTISLYGLPSLVIGGVEIRNWQATGASVPQKFEALDGIVGLDAFQGYVVTLDYSAARLEIRKGSLPAPDGKTVFAYDEPIPVVPLTVEGKTINAHLDTGNTVEGVIVPAEFASALANRAKAVSAGTAHTISNAIPMFRFDVVSPARVGDVALSAAGIAFPTVIDMANVGSKGLAGMIVRVDPANRRIELERVMPLT